MFKKLLVISITTLVLVGCGKKEVTRSMLFGGWYCNSESTTSNYESINHKWFDINLGTKSFTLFLTSNKNMKQTDDSIVYILDSDFKEKSSRAISIEDVIYTTTTEFVYISENKFKLIEDTFAPETKKSRMEAICTRITSK
ncbi:hypothetical protein [Orbus mooreae]|uniref:hypothetical protein n=1 Tax=Orbus mooreae TaxID=3074107 RepID=UPI00370DB13A